MVLPVRYHLLKMHSLDLQKMVSQEYRVNLDKDDYEYSLCKIKHSLVFDIIIYSCYHKINRLKVSLSDEHIAIFSIEYSFLGLIFTIKFSKIY